MAKDVHVSIKVEDWRKERWQKAAELEKRVLSDFARLAIDEKVDRIIAEHESKEARRNDR